MINLSKIHYEFIIQNDVHTIRYDYLGKRTLKNINRAVKTYQVFYAINGVNKLIGGKTTANPCIKTSICFLKQAIEFMKNNPEN